MGSYVSYRVIPSRYICGWRKAAAMMQKCEENMPSNLERMSKRCQWRRLWGSIRAFSFFRAKRSVKRISNKLHQCSYWDQVYLRRASLEACYAWTLIVLNDIGKLKDRFPKPSISVECRNVEASGSRWNGPWDVGQAWRSCTREGSPKCHFHRETPKFCPTSIFFFTRQA